MKEDESTEEEVKDMTEDLIIEEQVPHINNEIHAPSTSHRHLSFAHTESVPLSESSSDAVEQTEVSSGSRSDLDPDSKVIQNGDSKKNPPLNITPAQSLMTHHRFLGLLAFSADLPVFA